LLYNINEYDRESIKMIRSKDKASSNGQMVEPILASGIMGNNMGKDCMSI
jgi:hypothetical protein